MNSDASNGEERKGGQAEADGEMRLGECWVKEYGDCRLETEVVTPHLVHITGDEDGPQVPNPTGPTPLTGGR